MRSRVTIVLRRLSFGSPRFFGAVDEHDSSRLRSRDRNAPALDTILSVYPNQTTIFRGPKIEKAKQIDRAFVLLEGE